MSWLFLFSKKVHLESSRVLALYPTRLWVWACGFWSTHYLYYVHVYTHIIIANTNTNKTEIYPNSLLLNLYHFTGLFLTWNDIVVSVLFLIAGQGTSGRNKLLADWTANIFKFYFKKTFLRIGINITQMTGGGMIQGKPEQLREIKTEWEYKGVRETKREREKKGRKIKTRMKKLCKM